MRHWNRALLSFSLTFASLGLLASLSLTGCDNGTANPGDCDTLATVWGGDAELFFESYCLECHSTALTGDARQDAPNSINFDTYSDLTANDLEEVEGEIDGGAMPPEESSAQPTSAEVETIVTWLACGAPES